MAYTRVSVSAHFKLKLAYIIAYMYAKAAQAAYNVNKVMWLAICRG